MCEWSFSGVCEGIANVCSWNYLEEFEDANLNNFWDFEDCNSDSLNVDGIIYGIGTLCENDNDWEDSFGNDICDDWNYDGEYDECENFNDINGDGLYSIDDDQEYCETENSIYFPSYILNALESYDPNIEDDLTYKWFLDDSLVANAVIYENYLSNVEDVNSIRLEVNDPYSYETVSQDEQVPYLSLIHI